MNRSFTRPCAARSSRAWSGSLTNGPASVWNEQIPYGALDDGAVLHPKPDPVLAQEIAADALPGAWRDGETNGVALVRALSQSRRRTLPWALVREGIRAGVESRWIEVAGGCASPCTAGTTKPGSCG